MVGGDAGYEVTERDRGAGRGLGGLGVLALLGRGQRLVRGVRVRLRHGGGDRGAAARGVVASVAAERGGGRHRLGLGF